MAPSLSHRRSGTWPIDSNCHHQSRYTTCSTLTSSLHIRRRRNTGRHTRGHPRSQCKVKKNTKWTRSYRPDVRHPVIRSNTRCIGKGTPQLTTRGCPTRTYTRLTSLRSSMPKEERSKQLKGEESDYEESSSPSHAFHQQQPPASRTKHSPLPRRRDPQTDPTNRGAHCEHRAGRLDV
jgi:hypothetical protein